MTAADLTLLRADMAETPPGALGGVVAEAWKTAKADCLSSGMAGWRIARDLAGTIDEIIRALGDRLAPERCALLAVGGYGIGRLAPYSDVDILVLIESEDAAEGVFPILHALWDAGINLSQSVHTPESAIAAAREDMTARTAFLDARHLWGEGELTKRFLADYDQLRQGTAEEFVRAKIEERAARHLEMESSRHAVEPDVKEGRGGLRDLQTLYWLHRYLAGDQSQGWGAIMPDDLISPKELRRIRKLNDFLWSVRVHLHAQMGRGDNRLYFGVQDRIAGIMGFRRSGRVRRVERFMRYYFLVVQEVVRLTGAAIDLVEDHVLGEEAAMPVPVAGYPGLSRKGLHLLFADDSNEQSPRLILDLFHAVGSLELKLEPDAFTRVSRASRKLTIRELRGPQVRQRFVEIFRDSPRLEPVLRLMAETGFLGRMLPSFGGIVGKAEYGLFRQYTLDDHCLRSVKALDDLIAGTDLEFRDVPFREEARANRSLLAMALLLQETRAAMTRPSTSKVKRRLGRRASVLFDDAEIGREVAFLVSHATLLARTATRRNVAEPLVLRSVAAEIGNVRRLRLLSLFTLCRQRVAGVGSWEEYSRREVDLLVELLRLQIEEGSPAVEARLEAFSEERRQEVAAVVGEANMRRFNALLEASGASFWLQTDSGAAIRLAHILASTEDYAVSGAAVTDVDGDGLLNVVVLSQDRPTLFAECTGLAAMNGASVFAASGFSFEEAGRRWGVIMLQLNRAGTPPEPYDPSAPEIESLRQGFEKVALGRTPLIQLPSARIGDRRSVFDVTPRIRIDEVSSEDALIVEVEARDRPGLLYLLASNLSEIGIDILYTLVATYGHRAVDTFYIRDYPGYKITDPRRIEAIRRQLIRALGDEAVTVSHEPKSDRPPLEGRAG